MAKVHCCKKLELLLWKNWKIQINRKKELAFEIIVPLLMIILLIASRCNSEIKTTPRVEYSPINISTIFKLGNAQMRLIKLELIYSPQNPILDQIMQMATKDLGLPPPKKNLTAGDLHFELIKTNYLAGVRFPESYESLTLFPEELHFSLRFPSELRYVTDKTQLLTWNSTLLFPTERLHGPRNIEDYEGDYYRESFLTIQNAISMAFIKLKSGTKLQLPDISIERFPYPKYVADTFFDNADVVVGYIVVFSFFVTVMYSIQLVVKEKEIQLKAIMQVNGLQLSLHWIAFFLKMLLHMVIISLIISICCKIPFAKGRAVLTNSSWSLFICFLLLYSLVTICFVFMVSSFFANASNAALCLLVIWIATVYPYLLFRKTMNKSVIYATSLLSNSGLFWGFSYFFKQEATDNAMTWKGLNTKLQSLDTSDATLSIIMLIMLISGIIYLLICLYMEQVFPGDFGVARDWYFPFTKKFCEIEKKRPVEQRREVRLSIYQERYPQEFEEEPMGKPAGVRMYSLSRKFDNKLVVKNFSLALYKDDITVLLGHNGAGKTTLINMLAGILKPTSGTATINGFDITTQLAQARKSIGICTQHNLLFDDLSVKDHLIFFARLKGTKKTEINAEVMRYLKIMGLEDKETVKPTELSGGMKRKLAICCAFCGDAKVVFCDEPSSGLDPSARRALWELLEQEKRGRTVLLTTHYMDEADILGDRIAIMCHGELRCVGTSFFLKKRIGEGYHLICVKRENCNPDAVTNLLRDFIPNIVPDTNVGSELSYQLPYYFEPVFKDMLQKLEESSEELQLSGYGIRITSMEEVFMKTGAEGSSKNIRRSSAISRDDFSSDEYENMPRDGVLSSQVDLLNGPNLLCNQFGAVILKKILITWRRKLFLLQLILIPILFISLGLAIRKFDVTSDPPPMPISLTEYRLAFIFSEKRKDIAPNSLEEKIADEYGKFVISHGKNYMHNPLNATRFKTYIVGKNTAHIQKQIDGACLAAAYIEPNKIIAYFNNQPYHTAPLSLNIVHNAIARAIIGPQAKITVENAPLPLNLPSQTRVIEDWKGRGYYLGISFCFCYIFIVGYFVMFENKERATRSKHLQLTSGLNIWIYWLGNFLWDLMLLICTFLLVLIVCKCFDQGGFFTSTEQGRLFLVLLLFALAALPLAYLFSYFGQDPAKAYVLSTGIFGLTGLLPFLIMPGVTSQTKNRSFEDAFMVSPFFALSTAMQKLYNNYALHKSCDIAFLRFGMEFTKEQICRNASKCCMGPSFYTFEWHYGILPEIISFTMVFIVLTGLILLIEYGACRGCTCCSFNYSLPPPKDTDKDVAEERRRITSMTRAQKEKQQIVVDHITKVFGKFLAVNQVSFAVRKGECFGLLGVNGAGKTTLFRMVTGDLGISQGYGYIHGYGMDDQIHETFKHVGYCPQFDALIDELTGSQILKIFCLIRGVDKDHTKVLIENLAFTFGFYSELKVQIKYYSGGNKRKLSTLIAVIGGPSLIFLDEPTTGMDPGAKRQVWDMVCHVREHDKAIILTTHSMEECEAICTRSAIMVNGELRCIGSNQQLKNKFSKGLVLKVKLLTDPEEIERGMHADFNRQGPKEVSPLFSLQQNITELKQFIEQQFPDAQLVDENVGLLTFYIPLAHIKWSEIFGMMQENADRLQFKDYSVTQTSLDEIFLDLAKEQSEKPLILKGRRKCF